MNKIQVYQTEFGNINGNHKRDLKGRRFGQSFYEEIMLKRQLRKVYKSAIVDGVCEKR